MGAFTILITELARHGQTTYTALLRKYGDKYDYGDFTHAVYEARKRGLITKARGRGTPIVACGECPCCGRPLAK